MSVAQSIKLLGIPSETIIPGRSGRQGRPISALRRNGRGIPAKGAPRPFGSTRGATPPRPRSTARKSKNKNNQSTNHSICRRQVTRWLWMLYRMALFCALLSSPMPLVVPDGLLRLSQALRSLRRAVPSLDSQRAETPYPFRPDDGALLRGEYEAAHGPRGQHLVDKLGGPRGTHADGGYPEQPREYLAPPAPPAPTNARPRQRRPAPPVPRANL